MKRKGLILCMIPVMLLCACGKTGTVVEPEPETIVQEELTAETEPTEVESVEAVIESVEAVETGSEISQSDIIPEQFSYAVTVRINPLVELYFDENDVVVGVSYLNQDAVDAYEKLELIGCDLSTGMEMLVSEAIDREYMKEDGTVAIEISQVGDEETEVDTAILLEASQVANETILTKMGEAADVHVEISVSEAVTEKTGASEPVICTDCNGTGNNCPECGGAGIVNCKSCTNGVESCGTCNGTAVITCHGCHGSGTQGDAGEACSYCGGSGRQSCDACGGQGTFLCSWCKGELRHICPICEGNGTCSTCGGDGIL